MEIANSKFSLRRKETLKLGFFTLFVLLLAVVSIYTGAYDTNKDDFGKEIIFITRIPRTISIMLTGVALSVCGLVMQLITQNRMVEPTTSGTIEWAGLGLIFSSIFFPSAFLLTRMAFAIAFSFIGTVIFFIFLRNISIKASFIVPVAGMMMGAVISAITTFFALTFRTSQSLETWFQGSFSFIEKGRYEFLYIIIITTMIIYFYADRLTLAALGEDISVSLGQNYKRTVLTATILISLTTGTVAAVTGNIPFLGLIVPNIVSLKKGDNLRNNLPYICLLGMSVLLITDILSRVLIKPFEVPVSLILGSLGSVVFLILILRQRRRIK